MKRTHSSSRTLIALAMTGTFLSSCMVGPNFQHPKAALPDAFEQPASAEASSHPDALPIVADWWTLFDDPILTSLEARMATANLDVKAATARLLQSRAQRRVAGARENPSAGAAGSYYQERASPDGILALTGTGTASKQQQSAGGAAPFGVASLPGADGSPPYDLWQAGIDTAWELDLWGGVHRSVEAASAALQASVEDRRAILLSAQAELARDYIDLRATQTLLTITQQNLDIAHSSARLIRLRFDQGVATSLDLADAEAHIATTEARLPLIEARRDALINALCLLLAQQPRALTAQLGEGAIPALPDHVPIGLPSELARRRPDIRRAEAELHRATAAIGVAKADFYPSISLTGSFGAQSLALSHFGSWASHQFVVGPSISLPFFQGGRLKGMLALREGEQQEAAILFQQTVLKAWHEIDDALSAYNAQQRRRDRLAEAARQNRLALAIAQRRYREGAIDFLNVLSVQRALLDTQSDLASSNGEAAGQLVTLFKALGGGWESAFPETAPQPSLSPSHDQGAGS